jgi:hypothetical protein
MDPGRADADARGVDPPVVNVAAQKGLDMDTDLLHRLPVPRGLRQAQSRTRLITCSMCLRVLRGSEWMEAERVIHEIRSYELEAPPRRRPALCDVCEESIQGRRAQVIEPVAA